MGGHPNRVQAQQRVDVSGVAQSLLPVSVASFAADQRARVDVAAVIRTDLSRSGLFNMIDSGMTLADTGPLPLELRGKGIDMLVIIKIIAEAAQGFEGDPLLARLLVRAAARAGADAVKFQLVYADE
ncbi:MAG: hypothetical protein EBW19_02930, partial [Betaproteobacteria bacterium]|nr:hypothetical protein [Betaproteobacteria bacterium]